jgi:hypothetical protein
MAMKRLPLVGAAMMLPLLVVSCSAESTSQTPPEPSVAASPAATQVEPSASASSSPSTIPPAMSADAFAALVQGTGAELVGSMELVKDSSLSPRDASADALLSALLADHVGLLRGIADSRLALPDSDNRLMCGWLLTARESEDIIDSYLATWAPEAASNDQATVDAIEEAWVQLTAAADSLEPLCVSAQGPACYAAYTGSVLAEHPKTVRLLIKLGYREDFRQWQSLINKLERKTRKVMPDYPCSSGEGPMSGAWFSCDKAGPTAPMLAGSSGNDWADIILDGYRSGLQWRQMAAANLICRAEAGEFASDL